MSRNFIELYESDSSQTHTFAVDTERRTITGLIVPWGQSAKSQGRRWRFERGGIKWSAVNRVKMLRDHDNASAFAKAIRLEDTPLGLVGTFSVPHGPRGDEVLALAASGVLDGLSGGLEWRDEDYGPDPRDPGVYLVRQAALREVSLTAMPAFDDSRLTSVRASDREETGMPETTTPGTPAQPESPPNPNPNPVTPAPSGPPTPEQPAPAPVSPAPAPQSMAGTFSMADVQQLIGMINQHPAGIGGTAPLTPETPAVVNPTATPVPAGAAGGTGATFVSEPLPYKFSHVPGKHIFHAAKYDFSSDLFDIIEGRGDVTAATKRVNGLISAAFDTDTTDMAGLIPKDQRPDLWQPQMDYITPLWDMINSGGTDGTPFELPKYNSSSGLVSAATEGTEPAPGAMTVTTQTVTPTQLWGKVEITRQTVRRGGNPQISGIIWDQMLREYYEDREAAVATFLNTLTAATDITLTTGPNPNTNAGDLVTVSDLEAAIALLQFARGGNRFRAFAVHIDLYKVLTRVKDSSGRPLYPMINPMNANGDAANLFGTVNVAGTTGIPSWALGATGTAAANSWLFDPAKVRGWASAPERLDWNFGATVQTANIPQLSHVTLGIYGDLALANLDINGVRQVIYDPLA